MWQLFKANITEKNPGVRKKLWKETEVNLIVLFIFSKNVGNASSFYTKRIFVVCDIDSVFMYSNHVDGIDSQIVMLE